MEFLDCRIDDGQGCSRPAARGARRTTAGFFTLAPPRGKNAVCPAGAPPPAPSPIEYAAMPQATVHVSGMSALAPRYDGFILDLWGVIHDGVTLYPGVIDSLTRLSELDKAFLMLSNAPRRASAIAEAMAAMGMPERFCARILSSGEATWRMLAENAAGFGRRCLHIGPPRDESLFDGLDVERVEALADAEFIVNTGPWGDEETVADYEPVLADGVRAGLPMICANPDLEVIRGGRRIICAGALAARYEALGGEVAYFGKPYPPIYRQCLETLGIGDRSRILAVGDSLRTDIAGASAAGIDSALVLGGIHGEELGFAPGSTPDPQRLEDLFARLGSGRPTYTLPAFVWSGG